jgi:hypothetical protein
MDLIFNTKISNSDSDVSQTVDLASLKRELEAVKAESKKAKKATSNMEEI